MVVRPPGVRLLIIRDDELLLTREYRLDLDAFDVRLPGGKVVDTMLEAEVLEHQDLEQAVVRAADRELREEVGMVCPRWSHFDVMRAGSSIEWDLWYLQGHDPEVLAAGAEPEAGEWIEPMWVPFETARSLCLSGEIREARSAIAIIRLLERLKDPEQ